VKRDDDPRYGQLVALMGASHTRVTAVSDPDAFARHVGDALSAAHLVACEPDGPLVDVGSGGGVPGLVLAIRFPEREVTLVEATGTKAAFLEHAAHDLDLGNVHVACARAEAFAVTARDAYAIATARALAPPAVAAELCLPLVRAGGCVILYTGAVDPDGLAVVAAALAAVVERVEPVPGTERRHLVVLRKVAPTPARFPRRVGVALKRPLVRFT
jgi:16S rRNA (guanine527-N7)-methyltransferase